MRTALHFAAVLLAASCATAPLISGPGPSAAPSGLRGVSTSTVILIQWTNGDSTAATRVYLDGGVIYTAPAGASGCRIFALRPSTSYRLDLDHFKNERASPRAGEVTITTASPSIAVSP